jgi:hypothetical protein
MSFPDHEPLSEKMENKQEQMHTSKGVVVENM